MKQFRKQLELEKNLKEDKSRLRLFKDGFKDGLKDDRNHKISMRSSVISAAIGGAIMYTVTKDIKASSKEACRVAAKAYLISRIQCATIDGVFEVIEKQY